MNYFKYFFASLVAVMCVAFAMPVDAAIAIKKLPKSQSQHGGSMNASNTDNRGQHFLCLGGAKSATFSADEQGHSHLYVYDDVLGKEVEVNLEDLGLEYDEIPSDVADYLSQHPGATMKEAYSECGMGLLWASGSFVFDSDMFWENATIYFCDDEEFDSEGNPVSSTIGKSINTTFRMTGGTLGAIVIAGRRYTEETESLMAIQESECDKGTANIYISGGNIGYVAVSVSGTKYFAGTANIYMQNCNYTGGKIPNVYHSKDYDTTTFLATGVTYTQDGYGRMNLTSSSNYYSNADCNVLQDESGNVTCSYPGKTVTLQAGIQPITCAEFRVNASTSVTNNAKITASGQFVVYTVKTLAGGTPATITFNNGQNACIDAGSVNISNSNCTVYNLGTITYKCTGTYTCNGTWAISKRSALGRPQVCYDAVMKHLWLTRNNQEINPIINRTCKHTTKTCLYGCGTAGENTWTIVDEYFDISDTNPLNCTGSIDMPCLNYIRYMRNFGSTNYQALYLPYVLEYDNWKDVADMYRIKNIHEYDDDKDGDIDRWDLEIVKMKEGQATKPNTPYVIKPKSTGEMRLVSAKGATLYATDEAKYIDCSSTDCRFVFTGTPAQKTIEAYGDFYMTGDELHYSGSNQTLGTYRWYMSIFNRETGSKINASQFNQAKQIRVFCDEEDMDATGIAEIENDEGIIPSDAKIYDLTGRIVSKMQAGRIYIINGKKVMK